MSDDVSALRGKQIQYFCAEQQSSLDQEIKKGSLEPGENE